MDTRPIGVFDSGLGSFAALVDKLIGLALSKKRGAY